MTVEGEAPVEGRVDRVNGSKVPSRHRHDADPRWAGRLELTKFRNPKLVEIEPAIAPPNTLGLRSVCLRSTASTTLSLAYAPTAPNSSARWPSTRQVQTLLYARPCGIIVALAENSSEAFTAPMLASI